MLNHLLLAVLAGAAATLALPTSTTTTNSLPDLTARAPLTTHTVVAGRGGLRFDPDNIFAEPGSIVEFHFLPANHSVVEAAFEAPCAPKDAASFDSGFFPVPASADGAAVQSGEVFQFTVRDDGKPVWFYCAQGNHCKAGMVGVINQVVDSGKTLREFKEAAGRFDEAVSGNQGRVQGGLRRENPNPLSGF
jgi:plastocyanin